MPDIIDYVAELRFEDIPDRAVKAARLCLLDAVGCMLAGIQSPAVFNLAQTLCANA